VSYLRQLVSFLTLKTAEFKPRPFWDGFVWTSWQWDSFFSQYFGFTCNYLSTNTTLFIHLWTTDTIFLTFCWPCISVYLSQYLTNLMHKICFTISFISCLVHETATYRSDDTRGCVMQFWPPDDEHMCSKHVEAWNKTYCEINFVHQVG